MEIVLDILIAQPWTHINMQYVGKTKHNKEKSLKPKVIMQGAEWLCTEWEHPQC